MSKLYLAIPYSFNPEISYEIANKVAADLMQRGHIVFSPISHGHGIADYLPDDLRTNSAWWMQHDLPFIEWADAVIVVVIGGTGQYLIETSKGVQMEIAHAQKYGKEIIYQQHSIEPVPFHPQQ